MTRHLRRSVSVGAVVAAIVATVCGAAGAAILVMDASDTGALPDWFTELGLLLLGVAVIALALPAVLPAHMVRVRRGARPRGRRPVRAAPPLVIPPRDLAG